MTIDVSKLRPGQIVYWVYVDLIGTKRRVWLNTELSRVHDKPRRIDGLCLVTSVSDAGFSLYNEHNFFFADENDNFAFTHATGSFTSQVTLRLLTSDD
jgi:hypothetical protein